ncbi:MAG: hypothetical protein MJ145_01480 [Clostridia bacterium]|nr:hypothetical protein [Clostridia bacterium]
MFTNRIDEKKLIKRIAIAVIMIIVFFAIEWFFTSKLCIETSLCTSTEYVCSEIRTSCDTSENWDTWSLDKKQEWFNNLHDKLIVYIIFHNDHCMTYFYDDYLLENVFENYYDSNSSNAKDLDAFHSKLVKANDIVDETYKDKKELILFFDDLDRDMFIKINELFG